MWCGQCQADVAAEVSPDNQRVFCTACGALLSTIDAPPQRPAAERLVGDKTKDARELLQRWSTNKVLDPFGPPTQKREIAESPSLPSPPKMVAEPTPVTQQIPSVARSVGGSPASDGTATDGKDKDTQASRLRYEESASPPPLEAPVTRDSNGPNASPVIDVSAANPIPVESSAPKLEIREDSKPETPTELPVESPLPVAPKLEIRDSKLETPTVPSVESPLPVAPKLEIRNSKLETPATTPVETPTIRRDAAHPPEHFVGAPTATPRNQSPVGPFVNKTVAAEPPRETHRSLLRFPSWDAAVWRTEPSAAGSWSSTAGQLLAYLGVLVLTAGTCLVVWSYYGGPANYAPTGWLIATAGQMLLFFGVVTLVSGGLEQTTEQVNKRIEQLGDHIIRLEQAHREMNQRAAIPPHFGEHSDAVFSSVNERAVVEK